MHPFWLLCIAVEVILIVWATAIERQAIVNRTSGANGLIWFALVLICTAASAFAIIGSWVMVSGSYALQIAGTAVVLLAALGGASLAYLDRLGKSVAQRAG